MTVYRYCTPEWLEESARIYRATPSLQEGLRRVNARIYFRVGAELDWGIEKSIIFGGDVRDGELRELAFFSEEEATASGEIILAATPQEWKKILRKENKFVTDFMLGRIALEQGSKVGVLKVAPYANGFVDALTQVELHFPDELSAEELEEYRAYVSDFRATLGV
jgi:hypothetical protein